MPSLRTETAGLVRLASLDLDALWREVAAGASASVALNDLLPALVRDYGQMAAVLAAEWYDDLRDTSPARRRFAAVPLDPSDRGAGSLIGWALQTSTSDESLQALILGGVQRRIADHVRLTISSSTASDPDAKGWLRVGDGETCDWCRQYLDGEIRTVAYDFPAHDSCGCSAVPTWS